MVPTRPDRAVAAADVISTHVEGEGLVAHVILVRLRKMRWMTRGMLYVVRSWSLMGSGTGADVLGVCDLMWRGVAWRGIGWEGAKKKL